MIREWVDSLSVYWLHLLCSVSASTQTGTDKHALYTLTHRHTNTCCMHTAAYIQVIYRYTYTYPFSLNLHLPTLIHPHIYPRSHTFRPHPAPPPSLPTGHPHMKEPFWAPSASGGRPWAEAGGAAAQVPVPGSSVPFTRCLAALRGFQGPGMYPHTLLEGHASLFFYPDFKVCLKGIYRTGEGWGYVVGEASPGEV